jgi:light-harvesting complex II chlorophyll a/b binding protein 4
MLIVRMPGDRGFDPLGLSKPTEFLQVDVDELDQNLGKNVAGRVVGKFSGGKDMLSTDALSPYDEVCSTLTRCILNADVILH